MCSESRGGPERAGGRGKRGEFPFHLYILYASRFSRAPRLNGVRVFLSPVLCVLVVWFYEEVVVFLEGRAGTVCVPL